MQAFRGSLIEDSPADIAPGLGRFINDVAEDPLKQCGIRHLRLAFLHAYPLPSFFLLFQRSTNPPKATVQQIVFHPIKPEPFEVLKSGLATFLLLVDERRELLG